MGAWAVLEGDYGDYSDCSTSYMCGRRQCNTHIVLLRRASAEWLIHSSITYHIRSRSIPCWLVCVNLKVVRFVSSLLIVQKHGALVLWSITPGRKASRTSPVSNMDIVHYC